MRVAVALGIVALLALVAPGPVEAGDGGATAQRCPIDVGFMLDRSGSMTGDPGMAARAGAKGILQGLGPNDQSGVRGFSERVEDKGLSPDHAASRRAIDSGNGPPVGIVASQTDAMRASFEDIKAGGRKEAEWVMVVLSDGFNEDTSGVAAGIKAHGIRIFSIALGDTVNSAHMQSIASEPASVFYLEAATAAEALQAMGRIDTILQGCLSKPDFTWTPGCAGMPTTLRVKPGSPLVMLDRVDWHSDAGHVAVGMPPGASLQWVLDRPTQVTAHITDERGRNTTATHLVAPADCRAPDLAIQCFPLGVPRGMVVALGVATGGDAPPATWRWWIDGEAAGEGPILRVVLDDGQIRTLRLEVTDENKQTAWVETTCASALNRPPAIWMPDVNITAGELLQVVPRGTDPDRDMLTFAWGLEAVPRAALEGGILRWQPSVADVGTHGPVVVTVSDGLANASATFLIHVLPPPDHGSVDSDRDGVADHADNCPDIPNRDQTWVPGCLGPRAAGGPRPDMPASHGSGAACLGSLLDRDHDQVPDACDEDADGDRVPNRLDNCPHVPDPTQADGDGDGVGDVCDGDAEVAALGARTAPAPAARSDALASSAEARPKHILAAGAAVAAMVLLLAVAARSRRAR